MILTTCVRVCVCKNGRERHLRDNSPNQCVLVPFKDVSTGAPSSFSMIRAVATNHVVRKESMQATCRGGLQS